MSVKSRLRY